MASSAVSPVGTDTTALPALTEVGPELAGRGPRWTGPMAAGHDLQVAGPLHDRLQRAPPRVWWSGIRVADSRADLFGVPVSLIRRTCPATTSTSRSPAHAA
jgi:hypothetical protein